MRGGRMSVAPSARDRRLEAFAPARVDALAAKHGAEASGAWTPLDGVLGVAFTSCWGSTFLARELERAFAVGRIREALGRWLDRTGRPCRNLVYEPFAAGDISAALRVGDARNLEWSRRFSREADPADPADRACVERHQAKVATVSDWAGPAVGGLAA